MRKQVLRCPDCASDISITSIGAKPAAYALESNAMIVWTKQNILIVHDSLGLHVLQYVVIRQPAGLKVSLRVGEKALCREDIKSR